MRKLVLSVVAVAMLATSALFAQDRYVNMYLDADSGNVLNTSQLGADGNDIEVGFAYGQNFAGNGLDWLSTELSLSMNAGQNWNRSNNERNWGMSGWGTPSFGATFGVGVNGSAFGVDALDLGLSIDTDLLLVIGVGYGMEVGPGALSLGLGVELFTGPADWYDDKDGKDTQAYVFDAAYITVAYGLEFAEIWAFETSLELGIGAINSDFTATNPFNSFYITWENVVSLGLEGGFGAYAGFGLEVTDMIATGYVANDKTAGYGERNEKQKPDTDVSLYLKGGVSYTFDF